VRRVIADESILAVLERVVDGSNPQEEVWDWSEGDDLFAPASRRRGIPIGNLTSQFLANVFLDRFDHLVMDREGYGGYVRCCDDFLVFADTRAELWALRARMDACLQSMRLRLHPRKDGVHATQSPIPFLGFTVRRGVKRLQRAGVVRGRRRLRGALREGTEGAIDRETLWARVASWRGHAPHASNRSFVDRMIAEEGCAGVLELVMRKTALIRIRRIACCAGKLPREDHASSRCE
jgi:hypothetical protein